MMMMLVIMIKHPQDLFRTLHQGFCHIVNLRFHFSFFEKGKILGHHHLDHAGHSRSHLLVDDISVGHIARLQPGYKQDFTPAHLNFMDAIRF